MKKTILAFGLMAALLMADESSHALTTYIDQFTITRDGTTVLDDTFSDNVAPPDGPAGPTTYFLSEGTPGPESGGLLELNSANGGFSANAIETPRLAVVVTRLTSITGGGSQLGSGNLLSETGLFDLTIPTGPLFSAYGIRFSDNVADRTGDGQLVQLFVRFNPITGEPEIAYILQDFGSNTITLLGSTSLSPPAGADQISLKLFQTEAGGEFFGSYEFFDGGVGLGETTFAMGGALFQEVDYVRGQFFVAQAVPEPGSMLLLGMGLMGLGAARWWRRKA